MLIYRNWLLKKLKNRKNNPQIYKSNKNNTNIFKYMQGEKVIYKELSFEIVGILFEVYNDLGYGYKEIYYEKAIEQCFLKNKIKYIRQAPYKILFRGKIIGINYLDFLVENKIVLEIKKGNHFSKQNME